MKKPKLQNLKRLRVAFYCVFIIIAVLNTGLLLLIDSIVNSTLYSYELQFSNQWYVPYECFLRGTLITMAWLAGLSFVALVLDLKCKTDTMPILNIENPKMTLTPALAIEKEQTEEPEQKGNIKCSNCHKKFDKPFTAIDGEKLVKVCPYCKHPLDADLFTECKSCGKQFGPLSKPMVVIDLNSNTTKYACPNCNQDLS